MKTNQPPETDVLPILRDEEGRLHVEPPIGDASIALPSAACPHRSDELPIGLGLGTNATDGTAPVAAAIAHQDDALATLEARLTKEMLTTAAAISSLGTTAIAVGEELPDASHLDKIDLLFLSKLSFCCSEVLLKLINNPPLLGKQGELVDKLRLQSHQLFTEIKLNGQSFLMIALPNQGFERFKSSEGC